MARRSPVEQVSPSRPCWISSRSVRPARCRTRRHRDAPSNGASTACRRACAPQLERCPPPCREDTDPYAEVAVCRRWRSEERRVGKECRGERKTDHESKREELEK